MPRLRFQKEGKAIYISHLDTMALFPRVFLRAGLPVKFTQGMSPHAYVSIALPLPVGMSSDCELLDFTLQDETVPLTTLPERLNPCFPSGLRVLQAYDSPRKAKEICYLQCAVILEYDDGVSSETEKRIADLFLQSSLSVEKNTKKGPVETNIRPMIDSLVVERLSRQELCLNAILCAQNPSLNPQYLTAAITRNLPDCIPDFAYAHRIEVYDEKHQVFR